MDNQGILDPVSERNLYALNYVLLPCINLSLSKFQEGWNNHGIIEPNSIWPLTSCLHTEPCNFQHSGLVTLDFFDHVTEDYGIDKEDSTIDNSDEGVPIPRSAIHLSEQQYELLQSEIDPLGESNDYGMDIYIRTVEILDRIL